jgi:3-keto-disaccharide hydrolase
MKPVYPLLLALLATSVISPAADDKDFKPLFNGKDLSGWQVRNEKSPNAWKVVDGVLLNDLKPGDHGVDLITDAKFWNFTVRYEYSVPDGSNSGFYLRGRHEIQILGDHKSGKPAKGGNGAIYQHTVPSSYAGKPGGEWQTVEATMIGDKVTVILNGVKIHDNVTVERATGSELDTKVKEPGPFFLQGDHGRVSFRKIEVKELPKE